MSEEIQRSLGRIEGALEALPVIQDSITHLTARLETHLTDDTQRFARHDDRFDEHDNRIRKVEKRMSYFAGAMAVIVGLFEYFKS